MTDNSPIRPFPGFPAGRLRITPVPDVFFSELLPAIDDLGELKVTLHILWRLKGLRREPRYLALSELRADGTLLAGLDASGREAEERLAQALTRAVTRGTLLRLEDPEGGEAGHTDAGEAWFFLNSQQGREGFEAAQRGEVALEGAVPGREPRLVAPRANIYRLYEQNIGLLQPLIADQLRDAEATYPAEWIEEAFQIAVEHNKRAWAYVRGILERWSREGKDSGPQKGGRRSYVRGKYGDRIAH
jgi:DNA replication protein